VGFRSFWVTNPGHVDPSRPRNIMSWLGATPVWVLVLQPRTNLLARIVSLVRGSQQPTTLYCHSFHLSCRNASESIAAVNRDSSARDQALLHGFLWNRRAYCYCVWLSAKLIFFKCRVTKCLRVKNSPILSWWIIHGVVRHPLLRYCLTLPDSRWMFYQSLLFYQAKVQKSHGHFFLSLRFFSSPRSRASDAATMGFLNYRLE